jgi:hypothetical protein
MKQMWLAELAFDEQARGDLASVRRFPRGMGVMRIVWIDVQDVHM